MIPENIHRKEEERQLAGLLQNGDQEALAILYDLYAPVLLGVITRIIREKDAAEAVLQSAFLMVWEQKSGYDPSKSGLLTWMIMLAKESAIEVLKSGNLNKPSDSSESNSWFVNQVTLPSELKGANNSEEVFCILLPEEKTILDLIFLKGYSCKEAATELGIPVETLIKNLRTAIKHIQTITAS